MEYIVKGVRLEKNDLQNLKIDDCPVCKHPTLQARIDRSHWDTCLVCGKLLQLKYVETIEVLK